MAPKQYLADGRDDLVAVAGLVYDGVDVAGKEFAKGPDLVVYGAYYYMGMGIASPYHLDEHKAVEVGQLQVDDVEIVGLTGLKPLGQGRSGAELVYGLDAEADQDCVQPLPYQVVVVDYGYSHP